MANVVQKLVNHRSRQRYATFWNCLLQVDTVLADARKVANRLDDSDRSPAWASTAADLRKAANRVDRALATLCKSGKRWEAELISRDWRK